MDSKDSDPNQSRAQESRSLRSVWKPSPRVQDEGERDAAIQHVYGVLWKANAHRGDSSRRGRLAAREAVTDNQQERGDIKEDKKIADRPNDNPPLNPLNAETHPQGRSTPVGCLACGFRIPKHAYPSMPKGSMGKSAISHWDDHTAVPRETCRDGMLSLPGWSSG
jgi:hypothetical protein